VAWVDKNRIAKYAIRRAFYVGRVVRDDLISIFGLASATASRTMNNLESWAFVKNKAGREERLLVRKERSIEPIPGQDPPVGHDGRSLLQEILNCGPDAEDFGFTVGPQSSRPGELELHSWRFRARDLPRNVDYTTLLKALIWKTPVEVRYVGMKVGDTARWRCILPLCLHVIEGQMLVHAYDLQISPPETRALAIYRISGVRSLPVRAEMARIVKKLLQDRPGRSALKTYQLALNPKLTSDQVEVIKRELGLNDQLRVQMYPELEFHISRYYMSSNQDRHGSDIVWPIIQRIDEVA
jgi:hypothetical protein